ncbi:sterol desaturase family protein [Marivirga sp.]|uniref:sterol desaturase family protein n=1 Tax=Marivirga sp. TaxID=2018662 RepID=UPI002D7F61EE|nr:sterol desaturase family protein [Marivirga sp.]HET8861205.1 sterol desaturase family protein [Marivirga sp.]
MEYLDIFITSFKDYARYVSNEVLNFHWGNYLYWLIGISLFFYALELIRPWRKDQPKIRKDFWLDAFYMFFNFFLFSLVGYYAFSNVFVQLFNDFLGLFGVTNLVAIEINTWPVWAQLLTLFILRDFIHWNVHRLLHRVPALWEFHKVHHSVEQMGFAAHLRFHWMETIVYRTIEYLPLAMIGFGIQEFLLVHLFALAIGHFNHSNIKVPLGPFKYIFNNPQMHIWHHAKYIPTKTGVNFGISLSIWDYLFGTHYIPRDGRDEKLGFDDMDKFPSKLKDQLVYGLTPKKEKSK